MKANSNKTFYACANCGSVFARWAGQCPDCGAWDTLHEEKNTLSLRERGGVRGRGKREAPATQTLAEISVDTAAVIATGIGEFDNVLGGGAMPNAAEVEKMQAELARLDPKALEQLPKEVRDQLAAGGAPAPALPGLGSKAVPRLPGLGGGAPRFTGLPGLPAGKKK